MSDTPSPTILNGNVPVLINGEVLSGSAELTDNGDGTYTFKITAANAFGVALQQQLALNGLNFKLAISGPS